MMGRNEASQTCRTAGPGDETQRTEHVVAELRELQAQVAELGLGLGTQGVAAGGPEVGHGRTNGRVLLGRVLVDVAGVGDLALGSRVDAMDLARGEVLEQCESKFLRQGVDLGVLEELLARHVDVGDRGVLLQRSLAGHFLGEIVAGVEEFEEAANGLEVFVGKLDLTGLRVGTGLGKRS